MSSPWELIADDSLLFEDVSDGWDLFTFLASYSRMKSKFTQIAKYPGSFIQSQVIEQVRYTAKIDSRTQDPGYSKL